MSGPRTYHVSIPIRFADIDALGHVNSAVFLSYMEVVRTAFWSDGQHADTIAPAHICAILLPR